MARHKITIESDDIDELVRKLIVELKKIEVGTPVHTTQTIGKRMCHVCSFEAVEKKGISKNGKPYHAIFCLTENATHTKWLES